MCNIMKKPLFGIGIDKPQGITSCYKLLNMSTYRLLANNAYFITYKYNSHKNPNYKHSLYDILTYVSYHSGVPIDVLKSRTRTRDIVILRQYYCAKANELTKNSLGKIGKLINRDHATVIYAIKVVRDTIYKDYKEFFKNTLYE